MNLKKLEMYLRGNLLGPGPRLIKKRIYRAADSHSLRNNALYYWNMQNDRICVSDSQPYLNRSTNNCPVVTGNCLSVHHRNLRSAIRTAHCLACQQEGGTGHNKLEKHEQPVCSPQGIQKRSRWAKCVSFLFTIAFSKRFWPCWTFCNRLRIQLRILCWA
jgi:hypothetical protein